MIDFSLVTSKFKCEGNTVLDLVFKVVYSL